MKKSVVELCLVLCCLFFGGCQKEVAVTEPEAVVIESTLKIGLSVDSFVIERWIRDRDIFVSTAKSLGAEVNVQNANGDLQEQMEQIEYFIKKQMDVIVVIAGDCDKLTDVMKKAKSVGIKTMCYDRLIQNADCDFYISFDNEQVGVLLAEGLRDAIREGGDILMIQGPTSDRNVEQVRNGFFKVLKDTDLNVVYEKNCENWLAEYAFDYVKDGLSTHRDIKGIMCGNDELATQVFRALSEEQLAGSVFLVGQDGDLIACQRIMEGTQLMTAFKPIDEEARKAAEYAVKLGLGEPLDGITQTMYDGTYDVPYYELQPIAVSEENMEEVIIQGGFHAREDVFLNIK